jgi:MFS transporter, DHA1 family, multidrug resistance protein
LVREAGTARASSKLLLVLSGLSAFGPLTTDVYLPGLPRVASDLDASPAGVQLTLAACVTGLAVGQLVVGPLSDMHGRRRPLLTGLAAFVVASFACAAAPSLPLLIGARFAQGFAGAAGLVIARAMVRDLFSGVDAARTFSTLSAIVTAGPVFAPMIGGGLLLFTDWRGIFLALGVIGVGLFAATYRGTSETLPTERRETHALGLTLRTVGAVLRHRRFLTFALSGAFAFGTMFAYISASAFVYQDVFGFSAQVYSLLFAVNGLALMSANIVNGRLVARIAPERLLRAGLLSLTGGACATATAVIAGAGAAVILPLLLLTVASVGFVIANSITLAMAGEASRAGSASALFGLLQFGVGAAIAPLVGVAGSSAIPMAIAMAVSAGLALGSYLLLGHRGGSATMRRRSAGEAGNA